MTGEQIFFLSEDPRPEETGDPDDPRPEETGDPDDPRPEETGDPDDPRPEETGDPDDPRPEETGDPDDPRPEETGDPDDPNYHGTTSRADGGSDCKPRHPRNRDCRPTRRRRTFPYLHSGNLVVRLAEHLVSPADSEDSLSAVAERLGLNGLRRVLERYALSGQRLVDLREDGRKDPDRDCACKGPCRCGACPDLHHLERQARTSALPPQHSLASYWRIDVSDQPLSTASNPGEMRLNGWEPSHEQTVKRIVRQLNQLVEVDRAYRELAVTDPAAGASEPLDAVQEYLAPGAAGVNARWARAQMHGGEEGVGLVDLEQGWIPHEDLDADLTPIFGDNRHGEGLYRGHHGTAVLAQIVARTNNKGGVGIAAAVESVRVVSHFSKSSQRSLNVANAIRQAIPKMSAGDVLLLEVQRSYLPTEVDEADRDAIRLAVAHGIIVIEAAGNGNANLDLYVDHRFERILDRRSPDFRDSGAIMVGAAHAARPHNRLAGRPGVGSNCGSRVDCFAHGDRVATAGYGDLDDFLGNTDEERAYTSSFGGTSSAAPIVAGAALVIQAFHLDRTGVRLSPWEMRDLLADPSNGTRQGRGVRGAIGSMPDLRKILRARLGLVSDLYLRDRPGDTGAIPVRNRISASPDITVLAQGGAPPAVDDAGPGIAKCAPGKDYSICVRLHNRGKDEAPGRVRIYRSEVATLITPSMWEPLGAQAEEFVVPAGKVPAGGVPIWSPGVAWRAPAKQLHGKPQERYCFTAILDEPRPADPDQRDPVLPPGSAPFFDWREYRAFLKAHNNIASCNFHLIDPVDDRGPNGNYELDFAVTGTPDFARSFDFEILRQLPDETSVEIDAPLPLASRLARRRLWPARPLGDRDASLRLPSLPRLRIERLRLLAGARFGCVLRISSGPVESGHSLAIRQLYRGEEVGRITWQFRSASR